MTCFPTLVLLLFICIAILFIPNVSPTNKLAPPYSITPPGKGKLGFSQVTWDSTTPFPNGLRIGFRKLVISSTLGSVALMDGSDMRKFNGMVLLTIDNKGLLTFKLPLPGPHLLLVADGGNWRAKIFSSAAEPSSGKKQKGKPSQKEFQLKAGDELFYIPSRGNHGKSVQDILVDGHLTLEMKKTVGNKAPVEYVRIVIGTVQEESKYWDPNLSITPALISQRWPNSDYPVQINDLEKSFHYSDSLRLVYFNNSPSFLTKPDRYMTNGYYMMKISSTMLVIDKKRKPLGSNQTIKKKEDSRYFMSVALLDNQIIITRKDHSPFTVVIYRDKPISLQYPEQTEGALPAQPGDLIIIWPYHMCWEGNTKWLDPSPPSEFDKPPQTLKDFADRLFSGREIVLKVEAVEGVKPVEEVKSTRFRKYRIPLVSQSSSLYFSEIMWDTLDMGTPTGLYFNEQGLYLNDNPTYINPVQYFDSKLEIKKEDNYLLWNMDKGSNLLTIKTHLMNDSNEIYCLVKIQKDQVFLEHTIKANDDFNVKVKEGDLIMFYRGQVELALGNLFKPSKSNDLWEDIVNVASLLPNHPIRMLFVRIGRGREDIEIPKQSANYITHAMRMANWLQDPLDQVLLTPLKVSDTTNTELAGAGGWKLKWFDGDDYFTDWRITFNFFGVALTPNLIGISNRHCLLGENIGPFDDNTDRVLLYVDTVTGSLTIQIEGIVPFTLALYRSSELAISWSERGEYEFEEVELGDRLVVVPWTTFAQDQQLSQEMVSSKEELGTKLKRGFGQGAVLVAEIVKVD